MERECHLPVFLGVCESTLIRGDGVSQDFYGVSDLLALPFFPQNLQGVFYLLGLPKELLGVKIRITLRSKAAPDRKAWTDLETFTQAPDKQVSVTGVAKLFSEDEQRTDEQGRNQVTSPFLLMFPKMEYKLVAIPCPPLFVRKPDQIDVIADLNDREFHIGAFRCEFCLPPPISEQERTAIKSRPGAINVIWFGLQCKTCQDRVEYYLPLDQKMKPSADAKRGIFLPTAPDAWNCKCGATNVPLIYCKQGLHDLFRRASAGRGKKEMRFIPLYQRGAIAAIKEKYQKMLVDYADDEESLQKFIEANPILWNFLAPTRIWRKPPILTKHKADFGILTTSSILYFVEIEKPATRLVTKAAKISADLEAGLDQIRNWQIEVEKRREAVLDGLELVQKDVHDIRYVLIAGMASKTSPAGIEKIRRIKDPCCVLCFDELASFLHSTETALLNI